MQESIQNFIGPIVGILWGPAMLALLIGGGVYISFRIGFIQVRHFTYMWRQTFGGLISKKYRVDIDAEGDLSPFQAVTTALASTVGASNIVGVPVPYSLVDPAQFSGCGLQQS